MEIEKNFGSQKMPDIFSDPFLKDCIISLRIFFNPSILSKKWQASGFVEFKNKNTKGEQEFKADTFDECVAQMKAFIDNLKKQ